MGKVKRRKKKGGRQRQPSPPGGVVFNESFRQLADAAHRQASVDDNPAPDPATISRMSQEEAERLADEVRKAMTPYDAFDVVANLLFSNLPLDADEYKETEHRGLMSIVEYGARLCAERPSRAGSGSREAFIEGP